MKRDELITVTAISSNCEVALVTKIVDVFLDTIIDALKAQDRVELRTDFGSFVVRLKGGIPSVNGAPLTKVERLVSFKVTPTLKRQLKQSDTDYLEALYRQGATLQIERLKNNKA